VDMTESKGTGVGRMMVALYHLRCWLLLVRIVGKIESEGTDLTVPFASSTPANSSSRSQNFG
jgi:hypothetical protein